MTKIRHLFNACHSKAFNLNHRIVLAPMTRIRANPDTLAPTPLTVEYYQQRASHGGLLITEAVHISPEATPVWTIYQAIRDNGGHVPGIWTDHQMQCWKNVVEAVHTKGGKISCQLLHTGRVAQPGIGDHPLVRDSGLPLPPVSSSAIPISASTEAGNHYNWDQDSTRPRALSTDDIDRVCRDYQLAARNALSAGFDCVELHAAHGYLVDQFLCDSVNQRQDEYGGSLENRCRFLFQVVNALIDVMGPNRVAVRLSPIPSDESNRWSGQSYFGASCSDPDQIYTHAIEGLNEYPLAYLLLTEPRVGGLSNDPDNDSTFVQALCNTQYRQVYKDTLILAGGFTPNTAEAAIAKGNCDLIAFGRWFLSNPDLPERIRQGLKLTVYERSSFYGGNQVGYTDYPDWEQLSNDSAPKYRLMDQSEIGVKLNR